MIHPDILLKYINDDMGYGVFATKEIPKGTIVYVQDFLEIIVPLESSLANNAVYHEILDKYAYVNSNGEHVLSWDFARYINHSCNPNSISTGYGFEVAVRDIQPGEEITDDYGLFNMRGVMSCGCASDACRKHISAGDFEIHDERWDTMAREAIHFINSVEQPLLHFLDRETHNNLFTYINTGENYHPVRQLELKMTNDMSYKTMSDKQLDKN